MLAKGDIPLHDDDLTCLFDHRKWWWLEPSLHLQKVWACCSRHWPSKLWPGPRGYNACWRRHPAPWWWLHLSLQSQKVRACCSRHWPSNLWPRPGADALQRRTADVEDDWLGLGYIIDPDLVRRLSLLEPDLNLARRTVHVREAPILAAQDALAKQSLGANSGWIPNQGSSTRC